MLLLMQPAVTLDSGGLTTTVAAISAGVGVPTSVEGHNEDECRQELASGGDSGYSTGHLQYSNHHSAPYIVPDDPDQPAHRTESSGLLARLTGVDSQRQ